ncbi:hypothetical protein [Rhizobium laguerreae]|uniref:hypothetical protein n=1 Tax=Rhizobium laguerreae TaxID=1076926 RepID=UPI00103CD7BA|nr:hypothetical protein [Rhizobium laguerreae]TBY02095.1 hypothetical protein E0I94_30640 [Rhizobium laguerreae]
MTRAKHLQGSDRTGVTKASFTNKIAEMKRVLKSWEKRGKKDDSFWPDTLAGLADWDDPEKGIYRWTSPNVTQRSNKTYGDLVTTYWELQEDALPFLNGDGLDTLQGAKNLNQALSQQNSSLLWQVMELRDALSRVDANNEVLNRLPFP